MSQQLQPEAIPTMTRWQVLLASFRSMLGAPDYQAYVAHQTLNHPNEKLMGASEFFQARQAAKYRRGSSRCC